MLRSLIVLLCSAIAMNAFAEPTNKAEVDATLKELLTTLEGDWDSNWFEMQQDAKNVSDTDRQRHHHSIFRQMELPNVGEHVVYAQKWRDHDPDNIYVVNVYVFTPDYERDAIHLEILNPKDIPRYRDPHLKPEVYEQLRKLTVDDYYRMPYPCSTYWKKDKDGVFVGTFLEPCDLGKMGDGRTSYADTHVRMSKNQSWVASSSRGPGHYDTVGNLGHVARAEIKVGWYKCHLNVSNRVIPEPLERFMGVANGLDGVARFRNINLHDQGDAVPLTVNTSTPEPYQLKLTNHRNPDHLLSDEKLILELIDDNGNMIASGIAAPRADVVGFQSGDFKAWCDAKPGNWYTAHYRLNRKIDQPAAKKRR